MTVNQRIRLLREQKNLTQYQMGELFGLKSSTYSQKERQGSFSAEDVKIICDTFGVDPYLIIFGIPNPKEEINDFMKRKLTSEIEEEYRKKYENYETITRRDLRLLKLMSNLSRKKQDMVFEYAYLLFKKKKKTTAPCDTE